MVRIFTWRYDTRLNYSLYSLFMIFILSLFTYSLLFLNDISTLPRRFAIHRPHNETAFKVFYLPIQDGIIQKGGKYIHYCEYLFDNDPFSVIGKTDILVKSEGSPVCPYDYAFYFVSIVTLAVLFVIFIPLGVIVWYDFSQFWKDVELKDNKRD